MTTGKTAYYVTFRAPYEFVDTGTVYLRGETFHYEIIFAKNKDYALDEARDLLVGSTDAFERAFGHAKKLKTIKIRRATAEEIVDEFLNVANP